jgi:tetratricopeptide (TPR) repeat protein
MAEREFRAALAEEPQHASAHRMLALSLLYQSKFQDALVSAQEAARLDPQNAHSHYIISLILDDLKQYREAERAIDAAKKLAPSVATYHTHDAFLALQQGLYKEAIDKAKLALSLDPFNDQAVRVLALSTINDGDAKGAIEIAEQALKIAADSEHSHALMAAILKRDKKNFAKALHHYRESLRINPNFAWAREGYMEMLSSRNPMYEFILGIIWFAKAPRIVIGHPYAMGASLLVWMIVAVAGAVLSQVSNHLLTMYMRFDPLAVEALEHAEIRQSNILAAWIVATMLISAGLFLVWNKPIFLPAVSFLYGMPLIFTRLFDLRNEPQQLDEYKKYFLGASALGILAILCSFGPDTLELHDLPPNVQDLSFLFVSAFMLMCLFARRFPRSPAPTKK